VKEAEKIRILTSRSISVKNQIQGCIALKTGRTETTATAAGLNMKSIMLKIFLSYGISNLFKL